MLLPPPSPPPQRQREIEDTSTHVEEDLESGRLLSVLLDDDTRASDDLSGVSLSVDLSKTSPGSENLGVGDLDEVDLVLSTYTRRRMERKRSAREREERRGGREGGGGEE